MDHKDLSKGYVNHSHDIPDSDGWCWWYSCFHKVQGYNGTYRPYSFLVCRHLKSTNGKGDYNEPSDHYVDQLSHRIPSPPPPPLPPPYPLPFIWLQRGCRCIIHESLSFIQCHLLMLVHVMAGSNRWALAYQLHRLLGFHSAISSTLCMEICAFQFTLSPSRGRSMSHFFVVVSDYLIEKFSVHSWKMYFWQLLRCSLFSLWWSMRWLEYLKGTFHLETCDMAVLHNYNSMEPDQVDVQVWDLIQNGYDWQWPSHMLCHGVFMI